MDFDEEIRLAEKNWMRLSSRKWRLKSNSKKKNKKALLETLLNKRSEIERQTEKYWIQMQQ